MARDEKLIDFDPEKIRERLREIDAEARALLARRQRLIEEAEILTAVLDRYGPQPNLEPEPQNEDSDTDKASLKRRKKIADYAYSVLRRQEKQRAHGQLILNELQLKGLLRGKFAMNSLTIAMTRDPRIAKSAREPNTWFIRKKKTTSKKKVVPRKKRPVQE